MKEFMDFETFVNIRSPDRKKIRVENAAGLAFGGIWSAFDIYLNWERDYSNIMVKKKDHEQSLINENAAISRLAGNVSRGIIYYIGFGSGLWAYACAKLTGKKVIAIDNTKLAHECASEVINKFGRLGVVEKVL